MSDDTRPLPRRAKDINSLKELLGNGSDATVDSKPRGLSTGSEITQNPACLEYVAEKLILSFNDVPKYPEFCDYLLSYGLQQVLQAEHANDSATTATEAFQNKFASDVVSFIDKILSDTLRKSPFVENINNVEVAAEFLGIKEFFQGDWIYHNPVLDKPKRGLSQEASGDCSLIAGSKHLSNLIHRTLDNDAWDKNHSRARTLSASEIRRTSSDISSCDNVSASINDMSTIRSNGTKAIERPRRKSLLPTFGRRKASRNASQASPAHSSFSGAQDASSSKKGNDTRGTNRLRSLLNSSEKQHPGQCHRLLENDTLSAEASHQSWEPLHIAAIAVVAGNRTIQTTAYRADKRNGSEGVIRNSNLSKNPILVSPPPIPSVSSRLGHRSPQDNIVSIYRPNGRANESTGAASHLHNLTGTGTTPVTFNAHPDFAASPGEGDSLNMSSIGPLVSFLSESANEDADESRSRYARRLRQRQKQYVLLEGPTTPGARDATTRVLRSHSTPTPSVQSGLQGQGIVDNGKQEEKQERAYINNAEGNNDRHTQPRLKSGIFFEGREIREQYDKDFEFKMENQYLNDLPRNNSVTRSVNKSSSPKRLLEKGNHVADEDGAYQGTVSSATAYSKSFDGRGHRRWYSSLWKRARNTPSSAALSAKSLPKSLSPRALPSNARLSSPLTVVFPPPVPSSKPTQTASSVPFPSRKDRVMKIRAQTMDVSMSFSLSETLASPSSTDAVASPSLHRHSSTPSFFPFPLPFSFSRNRTAGKNKYRARSHNAVPPASAAARDRAGSYVSRKPQSRVAEFMPPPRPMRKSQSFAAPPILGFTTTSAPFESNTLGPRHGAASSTAPVLALASMHIVPSGNDREVEEEEPGYDFVDDFKYSDNGDNSESRMLPTLAPLRIGQGDHTSGRPFVPPPVSPISLPSISSLPESPVHPDSLSTSPFEPDSQVPDGGRPEVTLLSEEIGRSKGEITNAVHRKYASSPTEILPHLHRPSHSAHAPHLSSGSRSSNKKSGFSLFRPRNYTRMDELADASAPNSPALSSASGASDENLPSPLTVRTQESLPSPSALVTASIAGALPIQDERRMLSPESTLSLPLSVTLPFPMEFMSPHPSTFAANEAAIIATPVPALPPPPPVTSRPRSRTGASAEPTPELSIIPRTPEFVVASPISFTPLSRPEISLIEPLFKDMGSPISSLETFLAPTIATLPSPFNPSRFRITCFDATYGRTWYTNLDYTYLSQICAPPPLPIPQLRLAVSQPTCLPPTWPSTPTLSSVSLSNSMNQGALPSLMDSLLLSSGNAQSVVPTPSLQNLSSIYLASDAPESSSPLSEGDSSPVDTSITAAFSSQRSPLPSPAGSPVASSRILTHSARAVRTRYHRVATSHQPHQHATYPTQQVPRTPKDPLFRSQSYSMEKQSAASPHGSLSRSFYLPTTPLRSTLPHLDSPVLAASARASPMSPSPSSPAQWDSTRFRGSDEGSTVPAFPPIAQLPTTTPSASRSHSPACSRSLSPSKQSFASPSKFTPYEPFSNRALRSRELDDANVLPLSLPFLSPARSRTSTHSPSSPTAASPSFSPGSLGAISPPALAIHSPLPISHPPSPVLSPRILSLPPMSTAPMKTFRVVRKRAESPRHPSSPRASPMSPRGVSNTTLNNFDSAHNPLHSPIPIYGRPKLYAHHLNANVQPDGASTPLCSTRLESVRSRRYGGRHTPASSRRASLHSEASLAEESHSPLKDLPQKSSSQNNSAQNDREITLTLPYFSPMAQGMTSPGNSNQMPEVNPRLSARYGSATLDFLSSLKSGRVEISSTSVPVQDAVTFFSLPSPGPYSKTSVESFPKRGLGSFGSNSSSLDTRNGQCGFSSSQKHGKDNRASFSPLQGPSSTLPLAPSTVLLLALEGASPIALTDPSAPLPTPFPPTSSPTSAINRYLQLPNRPTPSIPPIVSSSVASNAPSTSMSPSADSLNSFPAICTDRLRVLIEEQVFEYVHPFTWGRTKECIEQDRQFSKNCADLVHTPPALLGVSSVLTLPQVLLQILPFIQNITRTKSPTQKLLSVVRLFEEIPLIVDRAFKFLRTLPPSIMRHWYAKSNRSIHELLYQGIAFEFYQTSLSSSPLLPFFETLSPRPLSDHPLLVTEPEAIALLTRFTVSSSPRTPGQDMTSPQMASKRGSSINDEISARAIADTCATKKAMVEEDGREAPFSDLGVFSADTLMPALLWSLLFAAAIGTVSSPHSELDLITRYCGNRVFTGQTGYCMTTLSSGVFFLTNVNPKTGEMDY